MKCLITKDGQDIGEYPCDGVYQSTWYDIDEKTKKETRMLGWFRNFDHIDGFETFLMTHERIRIEMKTNWTDGEIPIRLIRILKK